jgi:hypothetical protein
MKKETTNHTNLTNNTKNKLVSVVSVVRGYSSEKTAPGASRMKREK